MNPILLIPARMASSRLPGKPLADIGGLPMIVRVWRQAIAAKLGPVVVAAAEREIAAVVEQAGGRAVLTDPDLPSGSDRIWAALKAIDPQGNYDLVLNLQGDLPFVDPQQLICVAKALEETGTDIATLAAPIVNPDEKANPAIVKAVIAWDRDERIGRALYFTRCMAPWGLGALYHHVGLYAYRQDALARFVGLPPSALESREKLEQLRAIEAGMKIMVARVDSAPVSVDTPADLERARKMFQK